MAKKGLIVSYLQGVVDLAHGQSYWTILKYFFPEFVTNVVIYSLPFFIDSFFIGCLKSTSAYTTLTVTNTILYMLVKIGEGVAIGGLVLIGHNNGLKKFKEAGEVFSELFWVSVVVAVAISAFLYFGAYWIYKRFGVPENLIGLGVPFLRMRAIGMLFMYMYFAFVGFLRGIKNTKAPMMFFVGGGIVLIVCDWLFIFGNLGFAKLGLQGSAVASIFQYASMLLFAVVYMLFNRDVRKYGITLLRRISSLENVKSILILAWPVIVDKTTYACSYIWLGKMLAPMGKYVLASYGVVRNMHCFAIAPAVAFAQIVTFLVSNDYGKKDWLAIKTNIKKIVFLASLFVFLLLLIFSLWPKQIIYFFDRRGCFTDFSALAFQILSVLVFFDLLQSILAGALRGAQQVRIVMWVRLLVCFGVFFPLSYIISCIDMENLMIKFLLIFSSFYLAGCVMGSIYIARFRGEKWKTPSV